jgi:hypothetical protein
MFMGMIITRTATQIKRASVDTFLKIEQGSTEAGKALIGMRAEMEYLKFSIGRAIGEALSPLLAFLIPIIQGFARFAAQHPEITFGAIATALTVGYGLQAAGNVGMFLMGMSTWSTSEEWKKFSGGASVAGSLAAIAATLLALGNIVLVITDLFTSEDMNLADKLNIALFGAVGAAGVGFAMGGWWGAMLGLGLGLALGDIWVKKDLKITDYLNVALLGGFIGFKLGGWWGAGIGVMITLALADFAAKDGLAEKIKKFLAKLRDPGGLAADILGLDDGRETGSNYGNDNRGRGRAYAAGSTYVPESGMYQLHRGERVLSAGQNNQFSGGINITVNTSGGVSGDQIAKEIMESIRRRTGA